MTDLNTLIPANSSLQLLLLLVVVCAHEYL
jgi:hypothetical protein